MLFFSIALVIIIIYSIYRLYNYFYPILNVNSNDKYVLISGCDTGVGYSLALQLDQQGFNILAGVYLRENITSLTNQLSSRATVFHLDITKQDDIDAASQLVQKKTNTLHALINNAGIITHGCIDWTSMNLMRQIMDVNYFGHVAMTKTFLPLLLTKPYSRVVNMCSATGFFAFPNTCAYSSSKSALEAFSDCLRREMRPWGLHVSIIEPGTLRTQMTVNYEKNLRALWNGLSADTQQRWGIEFLNSIIQQSLSSPFIKYADSPLTVVKAIQHAVMSTKPCIRYRPGWQAKMIFIVFYLPPVWLVDKLLAKALHFIPAELRKHQSN